MSGAPLYPCACIATNDARAAEKEFFIVKLLVRVHFIILLIRWTGLAPWEVDFPFFR